MNKIILITGATDGIGLETAKRLYAEGHTLLLHGRNAEKLAATEATLANGTGTGLIYTYKADMSRLDEVDTLADAIVKGHDRLDVLINNAGVMRVPETVTRDGLDVRFAVNTIAPYLLTLRLLPLLGPGSRVVNLSSAAQAPVELDALTGEKRLLEDMPAYAQSKLALTMWNNALAASLGSRGPAFIAVNPGSLLASKMVKEGFGIAGKSLSIGADVLTRAALSDEFANASGLYFDNDKGSFAPPHPDALNNQKCRAIVEVIDRILGSL
ncbi:SDR family NAD(P)-dependent oxidoreductase [Microbulbifer thermotolerans]|uniref:SDR family NAD(P)-dependent oxidoreductase n=1 Tax=Microbulbifer thermotolerans TaxID=252514 RepID=UPI00224B4131|nr:SDR family NAD(P)-dependent oxidoreductase [Microbulbifer thermotolerans]MCX2835083.1 SDR family NAD(P)-dependent oxidoreductase [Microbulbifer thermotolerans]WKT60712.1 SDR family NAD(P)-dependent oxidoreductase [Microbulbifer thermotolerans]